MVLEVGISITREHQTTWADHRKYKKFREKVFKSRVSNVYKNKFHIDYYNYITQSKDYFTTSGSKYCNWVSFVAIFLKTRALSYEDRNKSQLGQVFCRFFKKDFHSNQRDQQNQSNIPGINSKTINIKKDKKQGNNKDLP